MRKSKDEIVTELREGFHSLIAVSSSVSDDLFNVSRNNKWTTAENIQHLVNATKMTSMAYRLPKILPRLLYGKPKRTSHGFSKIVDNYHKKLEGGAVATGVYVPKKTNYEKLKLNEKLSVEGEVLVRAIEKNWTDEELDKYQIAHPILGLLTTRELAYFTMYHNQHHLNSIRSLYLADSVTV